MYVCIIYIYTYVCIYIGIKFTWNYCALQLQEDTVLISVRLNDIHSPVTVWIHSDRYQKCRSTKEKMDWPRKTEQVLHPVAAVDELVHLTLGSRWASFTTDLQWVDTSRCPAYGQNFVFWSWGGGCLLMRERYGVVTITGISKQLYGTTNVRRTGKRSL